MSWQLAPSERSFGASARSERESGAVLVETAMVTMMLCLLSFGIVEFGLLLRQVNEAATSVRSAARTASISGNETNADYRILQAMKDSTVGLPGDIEQVMIFRADPATGKPTGSCVNFVPSANCNVYDAADVDNPATVNAKDNNFTGRTAGVTYIGVAIRADHGFVTKFFGDRLSFADNSVVLLEAAPSTGGPSDIRADGTSNGGGTVPPPAPVADNETPCGVIACNGGGGGGGSG